MKQGSFPFLGFGLGLRPQHVDEVLQHGSRAQWFEVISENYMGVPGLGHGYALARLEEVREQFPIIMHGVSMTIGSSEPLNLEYFNSLKKLIDIIKPTWVSDHICWTSSGIHNSYDLLPLPYNQETLSHLVDKVHQAQDLLGRQLVLENASTYLEFKSSDMTEWDFLKELVKKTDCGLLLDVNNVYVCSQNHGFDPYEYLRNIPWKNVAQIHLAGFTHKGDVLIDTHNRPVCDEVWDMLAFVYKEYGLTSTMIEWDSDIPDLNELEKELLKAIKLGEKHSDLKKTSIATL